MLKSLWQSKITHVTHPIGVFWKHRADHNRHQPLSNADQRPLYAPHSSELEHFVGGCQRCLSAIGSARLYCCVMFIQLVAHARVCKMHWRAVPRKKMENHIHTLLFTRITLLHSVYSLQTLYLVKDRFL